MAGNGTGFYGGQWDVRFALLGARPPMALEDRSRRAIKDSAETNEVY